MPKRVYFYFWLTSTLIVFYHVKFPNGHLNFNSFSLNYNNQLQNLNKRYILIFIIICYLYFIGILYWLTEKLGIKLKNFIKQIHVYTTLGIIWLIFLLVSYSFYFPVKSIQLINNSRFEILINTFSLLALIVQIIFLISFIIEFRKRKPFIKF